MLVLTSFTKKWKILYWHISIYFVYRGPSSTNPLTDEKYGTHFPMISVKDMCDSQKLLIDHLGINKVS